MTGGCPYHFPTVTEQGLDPDPLLVELLEREPVAAVQPPYGGECWLVTRYDDVRTALSDLRFSREATVGLDVGRTQPVSYAGSSILGMDPPGHSRIRRLVSATFTARRVEQLRPHRVRSSTRCSTRWRRRARPRTSSRGSRSRCRSR